MKVCINHPDRKVKAHDMCTQCYMRRYIADRRAKIRAGTWHHPAAQGEESSSERKPGDGETIAAMAKVIEELRARNEILTRGLREVRVHRAQVVNELALLTALLWGK